MYKQKKMRLQMSYENCKMFPSNQKYIRNKKIEEALHIPHAISYWKTHDDHFKWPIFKRAAFFLIIKFPCLSSFLTHLKKHLKSFCKTKLGNKTFCLFNSSTCLLLVGTNTRKTTWIQDDNILSLQQIRRSTCLRSKSHTGNGTQAKRAYKM